MVEKVAVRLREALFVKEGETEPSRRIEEAFIKWECDEHGGV